MNQSVISVPRGQGAEPVILLTNALHVVAVTEVYRQGPDRPDWLVFIPRNVTSHNDVRYRGHI